MRGHAGAAALVVEERHLTEVIAGAQPPVTAVRGGDLGLALEDDQEADASFAADDDVRALRMPDLTHRLRGLLELAGGHAFEDADRLEVHGRDSTSRRDG